MIKSFEVEVAYALPDKQYLYSVLASENMTVADAIARSGLLKKCPEIDLNTQKVGIFSRIVPLEQVVRSGDRIEIYRPLLADPKEIRKQRAQRAKEEGRADKVTGGRRRAE